MFLTYIVLGLTVIAIILLALVHSLVLVKEFNFTPPVKGAVTCPDLDCVFEHVEQLLTQLVCRGQEPRAEGLCRIQHLRDMFFLVCCENVCRIVEVKCAESRVFTRG